MLFAGRFILPGILILPGLLLCYLGVRSQDAYWHEFEQRQVMQGLYPQRTAYWERMTRIFRIVRGAMGLFFVGFGLWIAWQMYFPY